MSTSQLHFHALAWFGSYKSKQLNIISAFIVAKGRCVWGEQVFAESRAVYSSLGFDQWELRQISLKANS